MEVFPKKWYRTEIIQVLVLPYNYRKLTPEQQSLATAFAETETNTEGTIHGIAQTTSGECKRVTEYSKNNLPERHWLILILVPKSTANSTFQQM